MPAQYPRDIIYLSDEQVDLIAAGVASKVPQPAPPSLPAEQIEQIAQRTLELMAASVMPITLADADKEDIADLVVEKVKAAMAQAEADYRAANEAPPFEAGGDHAKAEETGGDETKAQE